ncbi:MAG: hypothetical protein M1829_000970 [Trizodia sp. TS-e1964]|nr:MAG: hypothetical protein M1829_000970 [Trizodia sp. TS-e1964]
MAPSRALFSKRGRRLNASTESLDDEDAEEVPQVKSPTGPSANKNLAGPTPLDESSFSQLLDSVVKSTRKRRLAKRACIEAEHQKQVSQIRVETEAIHRAHQGRMSVFRRPEVNPAFNIAHRNKAYKSQCEKLAGFIQRRSKIESEILSSIKAIETSYLQLSLEIETALTGRLADLNQSSEAVEKT